MVVIVVNSFSYPCGIYIMWKIPQFISPFQLGLFPVCLSFFTTDMLQWTLLPLFSYIVMQGHHKGVNPGAESLGCGVYTFSTCLQITPQKVVTIYAPGSSVGAFLCTYIFSTIRHFQILLLVNLRVRSTWVLSLPTYATSKFFKKKEKVLKWQKNSEEKSLTNEWIQDSTNVWASPRQWEMHV